MQPPKFLRKSGRRLRNGVDTPSWWNLAVVVFGVAAAVWLAWTVLTAFSAQSRVVVAPPATNSHTTDAPTASGTPAVTASATASEATVNLPGPDGQPVEVPAAAATLAEAALRASMSPVDNAAQPWDGPPAAPVEGFVPAQVTWSPAYISASGVGTWTFAATVTATDNPSHKALVTRTVTSSGDSWKVRASP